MRKPDSIKLKTKDLHLYFDIFGTRIDYVVKCGATANYVL